MSSCNSGARAYLRGSSGRAALHWVALVTCVLVSSGTYAWSTSGNASIEPSHPYRSSRLSSIPSPMAPFSPGSTRKPTFAASTVPVAPAQQAIPAQKITLFCEENSTVAGIKPNRLESWCAVVWDGIHPDPLVGANVRFDLQNPTQGGTYTFEGGGQTKTVPTNACGQACVAATGTSPNNNGYCTIKATWVKDDGTDGISTSGTILLSLISCPTNVVADPSLTYGPYRNAMGKPNSCGLTYRNDCEHPDIKAKSDLAKDAWNTSTYASFVAFGGSGNPNLSVKEYSFPSDSAYMRAPVLNPQDSNSREVQVNLDACDPCPVDPSKSKGAGETYPPASARHHLKSSVAHEIGHCLNLAHNPTDHGALLWGGITVYFLCGIDSPKLDEKNGLLALGYPLNCQ